MNKVLFISNYRPSVGGISGQVEILQSKLSDDGIQAEIFNTSGSVLSRLSMPLKLRKAGIGYDVFHIHACSNLGFFPAVIGILIGRRLHKRIILTYHGGNADAFFSKHKSFVKYFLTKTDTNIVLSGFLGSVFSKYGIPYIVIPNILDFSNVIFRKRQQVFPNLICTRTHDPLYDIPCIIQAFAIVSEKFPEASLNLVGDGTEHERMIGLANHLKLKNVKFPGRVPNGSIYNYLDKADIMVSMPKYDNMPVSILEGCAAGLLVISSNVGGVPYIISDEENGILTQPGDSQALADKILEAIDHQETSIQIMENAKESVKQYDWSRIKTKYYTALGIYG